MNITITKSDIGVVRKRNEDYCWAGSNEYGHYMMVVCDGLGSYEGSYNASRIAVNHFKESFLTMNYQLNELNKWFERNLQDIKYEFEREIAKEPTYKNMSTTIVLSIIAKGIVYTFWIGDSRAYILTKNNVYQITTDHNLINYLKKIKANEATYKKYQNDLFSVTHFIDANHQNKEYDTIKTKLSKKEVLVLCSDGLYSFLDMEILYELLSDPKNPEFNGSLIIKNAIDNGSDDNITFTSFYEGK